MKKNEIIEEIIRLFEWTTENYRFLTRTGQDEIIQSFPTFMFGCQSRGRSKLNRMKKDDLRELLADINQKIYYEQVRMGR